VAWFSIIIWPKFQLTNTSLNDGPFFTMIALGISGMANIPFMAIVAVLIPLLIGMLLGNLDEDIRELCVKGLPIIIPFNGFALGAGMNLMDVVKAGVPGIILGLISLIFTGFVCYWVYNWFFGRKKKTAVGMAVGNTAGNAVATPGAIGAVDPALAPFATMATAQVAAACVVTALLCPLLTTYMHNRLRKKEEMQKNVIEAV
jgi:2-keto-3-deoxygluconate permease